MITDEEAKKVFGIGLFGAILYKLKPKVAEARVEEIGNIVASEPVIYGVCKEGECLSGETAYVYVSFSNVGSIRSVSNIGIKVNDVIVKKIDNVGLDAGQEMVLLYELPVEEMTYNICGFVS